MAATAKTIINNVAVEVGLASVNDPYGSVDQNFILLRTLLTSAGRELLRRRNWSQFTREGTITGTGTTVAFSPPSDFIRLVNDTGWNRTSQIPLSQPIQPDEWQAIKASGTVSTEDLFRYTGGKFQFITAPPLNTSIRYEYLSAWWVDLIDGLAFGTMTAPIASGNFVLLDEQTITRMLKLKFLLAKGLDPTAASIEYEIAYDQYAAADPMPTLFMPGSPLRPGQFQEGAAAIGSPGGIAVAGSIWTAPDGTQYELSVDNDGNLITTEVP